MCVSSPFTGIEGKRITLLPRILPDNAGLVTIWNDNLRPYISVWRSVSIGSHQDRLNLLSRQLRRPNSGRETHCITSPLKFSKPLKQPMKRQRENDLHATNLLGEKSILDALPKHREQRHPVKPADVRREAPRARPFAVKRTEGAQMLQVGRVPLDSLHVSLPTVVAESVAFSVLAGRAADYGQMRGVLDDGRELRCTDGPDRFLEPGQTVEPSARSAAGFDQMGSKTRSFRRLAPVDRLGFVIGYRSWRSDVHCDYPILRLYHHAIFPSSFRSPVGWLTYGVSRSPCPLCGQWIHS